MFKVICLAAGVVGFVLASPSAFAQSPTSRVLFRVFLSDGRVLSSYGEWARLDDRVIFSMPAQLTREPIELHLVSVPAQRVDWAKTQAYAESVRAAAYAASRGDADFIAFTGDVAKTLNEISQIQDPRMRLATAERARQKLADWPASHYGYRNSEVREALSVLDEVIAELRINAGINRFDVSLSANTPLVEPPPPPLPPPTDAELAEQFVAAASIAESPVERIGLLQTVMNLIDRALGVMPAEWVSRMRGSVSADLEREKKTEAAYNQLRTKTLEEAARLASRGRASDLERLRDSVKAEDLRLGGQRPGDVAALLATIDLQAAAAIQAREARREWESYAGAFRRYRRSTNRAFKVFQDATAALLEIRNQRGPTGKALDSLSKRLASANRSFVKVTAPGPLSDEHAVIANAWELADNALRLWRQAVTDGSTDAAQRASSAAAGAMMLYQRARADQFSAMERPPVR